MIAIVGWACRLRFAFDGHVRYGLAECPQVLASSGYAYCVPSLWFQGFQLESSLGCGQGLARSAGCTGCSEVICYKEVVNESSVLDVPFDDQ